jgi:hypothetical protein
MRLGQAEHRKPRFRRRHLTLRQGSDGRSVDMSSGTWSHDAALARCIKKKKEKKTHGTSLPDKKKPRKRSIKKHIFPDL